jgi:mitochondrial import inner membrane translocase subunit TIM54
MLGLPALPRKLPSRNWLIFWTLTTSLSAAIIYDKREKKRATARWARAVSHLANEPLRQPTEQPRRLTVYLECPPGDGLRVSQDHFLEYVKPVLAASGLDWEFVQGREEGDVRAAVAERIRRERRAVEAPEKAELPTEETVLHSLREKSGIKEYEGRKGDLIVGRHAWKEYMRGLHEGWLGPLDPPAKPDDLGLAAETKPHEDAEDKKDDQDAEKKDEEKEKKPERPPQPPPYNTTADYSSSSTPPQIPPEFDPVVLIQEPHILGFSKTHIRINWFLNRRKLADDIGRQAAAICLGFAHEWPVPTNGGGADADPATTAQTRALEHEESFWPKSVWKDEKPDEDGSKTARRTEKIWTAPIVTDTRITSRVRKFEVQPEDAARARSFVIPEEEVEGWIKGSLRSLARWGVKQWKGDRLTPNVGDLDSDD